jgi:hypothetical protein
MSLINKLLIVGLMLVLGGATGRSVFAEESAGNKVQDAAGDASAKTKKVVRKGKQKVRKAVGTDTMGKDIKDKVNDVGDDVSNEANKAKRKGN